MMLEQDQLDNSYIADNSSMDYLDKQWFQNKAKKYRPDNVLREHDSINWFRSRKSHDTNEHYLHSEEQLRSKRIVHGVVKEMNQVKNMRGKLEQLTSMVQIKELSETNRFSKQKPDENPFNRTYVGWQESRQQIKHFNQTSRLVQNRQVVHPINYNLPDPASTLTKALFPVEQLNLNKCYLASLKKIEVGDDAMASTRFVEGQVQDLQRQIIHDKLKVTTKVAGPRNKKEGANATRRCVNNFIKLFKQDCQPVLRETNEFYQLKKIQAKSHLSKSPLYGFERSPSVKKSPSPTYGMQQSAETEGSDEANTSSAYIEQSPQARCNNYQYMLRNNRSPEEGQILDRIQEIIQGAKITIRKKKMMYSPKK